MLRDKIYSAFKQQDAVLGKGERGYIVNLTADGRPVFATTLETNGIGRCLNFQDIAPIMSETEADRLA